MRQATSRLAGILIPSLTPLHGRRLAERLGHASAPAPRRTSGRRRAGVDAVPHLRYRPRVEPTSERATALAARRTRCAAPVSREIYYHYLIVYFCHILLLRIYHFIHSISFHSIFHFISCFVTIFILFHFHSFISRLKFCLLPYWLCNFIFCVISFLNFIKSLYSAQCVLLFVIVIVLLY